MKIMACGQSLDDNTRILSPDKVKVSLQQTLKAAARHLGNTAAVAKQQEENTGS